MLRRNAHLLHFQGEVNPFFVLSGLGFPQSGSGSDALDASHVRAILGLAEDCGSPADRFEDVSAFAFDLRDRLAMQWPGLQFERDDIHARVVDTLRYLRAR